MDPQRIPPEYWQDRLAKARAMGLNTIFSYVYWNLLEPQQGEWKYSDASNNVTRYFELAQEQGLVSYFLLMGVLTLCIYSTGENSVPDKVYHRYKQMFLSSIQLTNADCQVYSTWCYDLDHISAVNVNGADSQVGSARFPILLSGPSMSHI